MLNKRFKQWKGPSKGFIKDYEIFADLRLKLVVDSNLPKHEAQRKGK